MCPSVGVLHNTIYQALATPSEIYVFSIDSKFSPKRQIRIGSILQKGKLRLPWWLSGKEPACQRRS